MVTCKCIAKQRDKSGNIVRYALQDAHGNICRYAPNELKFNISYGYIEVVNLKLTSDNRLIDSDNTKLPKIPEVDRIEYTPNEIDTRTFESGRGNIPERLHGWMDEDDGVYKESIRGLQGGLLEVGRLSWGVTLQPEESVRIGVWVNTGWYISGPSIERFAENLKKAYAKAVAKMEANPYDTWELEGPQDTGLYSRDSITGGPYVSVWMRHSQIWLNSESDIDRFLAKLTGLERRVNEVREIKGWRAKKTPVMNADGTITTKGNWFNKFFGKK